MSLSSVAKSVGGGRSGANDSGVWIHIAVIASVALLVRLVYLWGYQRHPLFAHFILDALWHHEWALDLKNGNWMGDDVFFRAPLYPYFLGIIYSIGEASHFAARLAQFTLGAASSVLVYLIGRRLLSKDRTALIAALAFALYGPMIYFEGELLIPSLIVFFDLSALQFLLVARERSDWRYYAASGVVFGLSAVARPNVIVPVMAIAVLTLVEKNGSFLEKSARKAFPFLIAFLVFPMLTSIRNQHVGDDFVFIASQAGVNFYLGNNPRADGRSPRGMESVFAAPTSDYQDSVRVRGKLIAEDHMKRSLKPSEVSNFWLARSFLWMRSNPIDSATLFGKKIFYLIHGYEIFSNNTPYFSHDYSPVMKVLIWDRFISFPAGVLIPLGLLGMILTWPRRRLWAPIYLFTILYAGTIALFFVTSRYRMPCVGPLMLFAASGLCQLTAMYSEERWKTLLPVSILLAGMLVLSNADAFDVRKQDFFRPQMELGNFHLSQGEWEKAEGYFRLVLKARPDHAIALTQMGVLSLKRKDFAQAQEYFRRSISVQPNRPANHYYLGVLEARRGSLDAAEKSLERALSLDPNFAKARSALSDLVKRRRSAPRQPPQGSGSPQNAEK